MNLHCIFFFQYRQFKFEEFEKKVFAIAFTDSVHFLNSGIEFGGLIDVRINYASSLVYRGEVYCFLRRQLIFSFDRSYIFSHISFEMSKRVHSEIQSFCLSVCLYHDLQMNSGTLVSF